MAKEYNISKTSGQCFACKNAMTADQEFMAAVREKEEAFEREDYCLACWEKCPHDNDPDVFGVWRSRVPEHEEKKRLFVDDDLLVNFFQRLSDANDAAKVSFRFVLALVLMRKKMLVYDRMKKEDGKEIWLMHFKGDATVHEVLDPKMDEDKIAQVSQNLGQIMEGEL